VFRDDWPELPDEITDEWVERQAQGVRPKKNGTGLHLGAKYLIFWRGVSNSWPSAGLAKTP